MAWLHVGPLGHLYGFAADFTEMLGRFLLARARERLREMRSRARARA